MLVNVHQIRLNPLRGQVGEAKYHKRQDGGTLENRLTKLHLLPQEEQYLIFVNDRDVNNDYILKQEDTVTIYLRRGL